MIRFTIEAKGMVELKQKLKRCAEEMGVALDDEKITVGLIVDKPEETVDIKPTPEVMSEEVELPERKAVLQWPQTNSQGQLVDVTQTPWDKEVHSSNKKCSKNGKWMLRRGTGPNSKKSKELENHASTEAPLGPPIVKQAPPVQSGPPVMSAPPVQSAPPQPEAPVDKFDATELMGEPMTFEVFVENMQAITMTLNKKNETWGPYFEKWFADRGVDGVWAVQEDEALSRELYETLIGNKDIIRG